MKHQNSESSKRYFKAISNLNPLNKEEEQELAHKIKGGCRKSLNRLVEHNLKIVVTIANKNANRGILVDDLIQQGNIGLYEAALRYDPDSGTKFATFAITRVLKMMNHLIDECGRPVRIPVNQEYQRYLALKRGEEVENIRPVYIDSFLGEDEKETYGSRMLADVSPGQTVEDISDIEERVKKMLSLLNDKELSVIKQSYGIGCEETTNKDIAEKMGVTAETIGNIKKRAFNNITKVYG